VGGVPYFDLSAEHHDLAIRSLRLSGQLWILIEAIVSRALLNRVRMRMQDAEADLSEAEMIATRSSMLLWQIETALERTSLALALNDRDQAKKQLSKTRELVKKTEKPWESRLYECPDGHCPEYASVFTKGEIVGYHCRNDEIEALQRQIDLL